MTRFTLTMTRDDGRTLTVGLDSRSSVRNLVTTVLSVLTFRPEGEFFAFASALSLTDDGSTITHSETGVMFELTTDTED